jgi:hypothetical protein
MLRPLPRPDNRLYLGAGGSGKTTLALRHAEKFDRVLFVQPDDSEPAPYAVVPDKRALIEGMMHPQFRLAFIADLQLDLVEWANEAAFRAGDVLVIWEEAGTMLGTRALKERAPWAFSLWMRGRHRRCRVFACSQRPASVAADLRANVSRAIIFQTTEPADLDWYQGMIGQRRETIETIRGLDYAAHQALDWTRTGQKVKHAPFD